MQSTRDIICFKILHVSHLHNLLPYWWIMKLNGFLPPIPHSSVLEFWSWIIFRDSDTEAEDADRIEAELYVQDYLRSPSTKLIWFMLVFFFSVLIVYLWPMQWDCYQRHLFFHINPLQISSCCFKSSSDFTVHICSQLMYTSKDHSIINMLIL